jgi:hypothetical protein
MTIEELIELLDKLRATAGDPEAAHGLEDEIWEKTLMHIAFNCSDGDEMSLWAHRALETKDVEFSRWRA